jgi:hypothetical protein
MTSSLTGAPSADTLRALPDVPLRSRDGNAELPPSALLTRSERLVLAASLPLACLVVWAGERAGVGVGDLRRLSDFSAVAPRRIAAAR